MNPIKHPIRYLALAWAAGLMIALLCPIDILDRSPILRGYVSAYLNFFSYKKVLGSESAFPGVAQLYHSLMAWTTPLFAIAAHSWMTGRVGRERDGILFRAELSFGNKLGLLALIPIWICLIWFASMNDGGDVRLVPFGTSRIALGFLGAAFPCLVGVLLSAIIFSIQRVFFDQGGKA